MSVLDELESRMESVTLAFCRTDRIETGETGKHVPAPVAKDQTITDRLRRADSDDTRMEQATQQFCRSKVAEPDGA